MKTKNNVQKAILKSLAVVVSFVLISFTVSAQDFWESLFENSTFSEIALAMAESNPETSQAFSDAASSANLNAFTSLLEEETEEDLDVEDWMTNEANFATSFLFEEEIESQIELENWMTDESNFNGTLMILEVETEDNLEVESWMLATENFEVENHTSKTEQKKHITAETFIFENLEDSGLELEPWMLKNKVWKN